MTRSRHSRRYSRLLVALRQARKDAGLTQNQVAAKLDNHASYVSKCESGERRLDVVELADFCQLYGISLSALLLRAGISKTSA
jgi:transcriptional regulator with XRE-family HTH domain